tara:strand:+ start:714 stop:1751 length:1038 start_codon:yes stop_codon:yes gene_type:complete
MTYNKNSKRNIAEIAFQLILHILVFVFYSFDRSNHHKLHAQVDLWEVAFFLNYSIAGLFINYFLLPKFLYKKKPIPFFIGVLIVIGLVIINEELVLEQIFFPDTRGKGFPGIIYNLIELLPIITILTGFKFAWDALTKQREVEALQSTVKESQLLYLKSQINPHFLFNNLNNLYAYALEQSPKTPEIILELSGVLRYMLYDCQAEYVPLKKEVEQLENFINLSKLQLEDRGDVNLQINITEQGFQIAPLILSVFIENAFKHSTSSQSDNIQIDINLNLDDTGNFIFTCSNSYSNESNTDSLSHGIGLENVKKRLELIYPNQHQLDIENTDGFYKVSLKLQLKNQA